MEKIINYLLIIILYDIIPPKSTTCNTTFFIVASCCIKKQTGLLLSATTFCFVFLSGNNEICCVASCALSMRALVRNIYTACNNVAKQGSTILLHDLLDIERVFYTVIEVHSCLVVHAVCRYKIKCESLKSRLTIDTTFFKCMHSDWCNK